MDLLKALGRVLRLRLAPLAAACLIGSSQAAALEEAPLEARVKAAFILNFAKFVEWPADVRSPEGSLVIGVLGETPVLAALKAFEGQEIHGQRLVVRSFPRAADAQCRILFVDNDQIRTFAQDAEKLQSRAILTVGEGDAFLGAGGIIALVRVNGNVRYRINLWASKAARLNISSKVLKLADRIEDLGGPQ